MRLFQFSNLRCFSKKGEHETLKSKPRAYPSPIEIVLSWARRFRNNPHQHFYQIADLDIAFPHPTLLALPAKRLRTHTIVKSSLCRPIGSKPHAIPRFDCAPRHRTTHCRQTRFVHKRLLFPRAIVVRDPCFSDAGKRKMRRQAQLPKRLSPRLETTTLPRQPPMQRRHIQRGKPVMPQPSKV